MPSDYPVEISPPDIEPYKAGNTGIDYVTTFDSGRPGPHVMVSAVVHGNELCGAIALDFLFRREVRPALGKLTLAFMNVAAYRSFDAADPNASRYIDEDYNRVWSAEVLDGERDSVELRRARELRGLIDGVEFLLDIHSMQHATVPLMMAGPHAKGRAFARDLGVPEIVVCDRGHAAGTRMRDYGGFGDPDGPKNALLIECGQHWEARSVQVAIDVMLRFLGRVGVADGKLVERHIVARELPEQRAIEVTGPATIETDAFRFASDYRGLEVIPKAGTIIGFDGEREVKTPYDDCVLIMPSRRLRRGETAVRFGRYLAD